MNRNNTIGIVGHITAQPELIVDAAEWAKKVYETTLTRVRPSNTEDTYILQFDGRAAGSREMLEKITEGVEVLVGGEIRSENAYNPKPEENRVKIYIYAEAVLVNDPPAKDQNEVEICGCVCKPPRFRMARRRTIDGKKIAVASIVIAANSRKGTSYIPCVCFGRKAFTANTPKVGDRVEIYGRFQSRDFKKRIKGRKLPFLCTAYEVNVIEMQVDETKDREAGRELAAVTAEIADDMIERIKKEKKEGIHVRDSKVCT